MIYVVDCETTGLDFVKDQVCELAAVELLQLPWRLGRARHCLVNPEIDIPVAASAVHHIRNDDAAGALTLKNAVPQIFLQEIDILVAHNSQFDKQFLGILGDKPWVCTYRCAQHLLPDAPAYGLQVLRYYTDITLEPKEGRASQPHAAVYDALTAAHLTIKLLELVDQNITALVELTNKPLFLRRMPFGKYRGETFDKIPRDYLVWLRGRDNLDVDLLYTLDTCLK